MVLENQADMKSLEREEEDMEEFKRREGKEITIQKAKEIEDMKIQKDLKRNITKLR